MNRDGPRLMADRYKSLLLFGGPGVGKGTQGKLLGAIPGFHHCATGDIFRSIDPDSELGKIFNQYSSRGELVPDQVTVDMWLDFMHKQTAEDHYNPQMDLLILDGIPRTTEQARIMDDLIEPLKVLYLVCADPQAMFERLRRRALKQGRNDDADESVIRNRWQVYERESAPVLDHYPKGLISEIEADTTPAQVLQRLLAIVEPMQSQHFPPFEG